MQSESDEQEVCEDAPNLPEIRTEFISEPEEEESNTMPDATEEDHLAERGVTEADQKVDVLQEESFVPSIDSNEEDEVSEYSHSMEGSDEEREPQAKRETLDDSSSSSAATRGSSLKYSSVGQTTMSTSTYKQRFTMSSSSSSEEEEEEKVLSNESDEELRLQEMAALRKPVVSGYSQVEPDLEAVFDDEEEEVAAPVDQEPVKMEEEEDEGEGNQQCPAQISGYSQVEPDLEDIEVIEDEEEQLEAAAVEQPAADPGADLVDSPQSPVSDGAAATSSSEDDKSCVDVDSDDEKNEQEEEQGDEEEEDFELHLAETPKSNVTRRSSHRRRFSMSSIASSESSPEENKIIHEEEDSQHENQVIQEEEDSLRENQVTPEEEESLRENRVIEPEMSPTSDSQSGQLNPEEIAEQERQRKIRIQRSSVFKVLIAFSIF